MVMMPVSLLEEAAAVEAEVWFLRPPANKLLQVTRSPVPLLGGPPPIRLVSKEFLLPVDPT
jgi:hypothetical protein